MRDRRFVYVGYQHYLRTYCVITVDYEFLAENQATVLQWLEQHMPAAEIEGCMLFFPSEESAAHFLLKWG